MKPVKSKKVKSEKVKTETPRTDAFCVELPATVFDCNCWGQVVALAQFARELELETIHLREICRETRVLLDGAYDLVEIHGGGSPYNDKWRKNWMEKARSFGATPSL